MKKQRVLKIVLITMTAILLLLSGVIVIYAADYYRAGDVAAAILTDNGNNLEVFRGGAAIGSPDAETGFIFYPGGKVEYTAYLPLLEKFSEAGIFCVVARMPFNLAVFNVNAADSIMARYPNVSSWLIGGHSLGGAMAAGYAGKRADRVDGLVLLAAYPATDLTDCNFPAISVYGSEDGVLNRDKLVEGRSLMPPESVEVEIGGGNHAQFGDYGVQAGDGLASISAAEQIDQTVSAVLDFVQKVVRQP